MTATGPGGSIPLTERTDARLIAARARARPIDSTVESLWPEHLAPLIVAVLDALARDVRIEVQPDEALARWDSAMIFASLGHDGLERSRGGAWA